MSEILPPPIWIDRRFDLERLLPKWLAQPRLAVDTESNSLYVYRERVCLIQFSTPEADYLIDPLAIDDLSPLGELFAHPGVEKVFHAAEYDLIGLKRDFGFQVVNLFDTMQSARILGYPKVGLDTLLASKYGVQINKRYQKANWGLRPLPPAMLNYARLDTRYLLRLRQDLQNELEQAGLWPLAQEEFRRLARGNDNHKEEVPFWQRIAQTRTLTPVQRGVLKALWEWREQTAERLDCPVFKVVSDHQLLALAHNPPSTVEELRRLLSDSVVRRYGQELLQTIQCGLQRPVPRLSLSPPAPEVIERLSRLNEWRRQRAQELGLESDLILPKAWLQAIAERPPERWQDLAALMPDSPWRLERFGKEILALLADMQEKNRICV